MAEKQVSPLCHTLTQKNLFCQRFCFMTDDFFLRLDCYVVCNLRRGVKKIVVVGSSFKLFSQCIGLQNITVE